MQSRDTEHMQQQHVFLSLGSNLGKREDNLTAAIELLQKCLELVQCSSVYESEPVGYSDQGPFLNMACHVLTTLPPLRLLDATQRIEVALGRTSSFTNGPRVIDIDILLYGGSSIHTSRLDIPHPRISERAFVLVPLAEIAPNLIHPELGKTIHSLQTESTDNHWVRITLGGHDVPTIR